MQLVYTQDPVAAYPGMPADLGFKDDVSAVCEETLGIDPGLVVVRGLGGDMTARLPPTPVVDVDAIKTNIGSTAGVQNLTVADFNGVIGAGRIYPPQRIELVLSSHADWNATNATLGYEDENGILRSETLAIPDNGNATVRSVGFASRVMTLSIPAQAGAGGTATLGISALATIDGGDTIGLAMRTQKARRDGSASDTEMHLDEESMLVRRQGRAYVIVENAFSAGDMPYVRLIAAGAEQRGAIRVGDTDGGDCVPWTRARLLNSGSAGGIGVLDIRML
jgi:hypothetical protein